MNPALKSFEHYPYVHRLPMKMGLYTLVELLGQGGMGAVYRGYREGGDGRRIDVAIKVVRDSVLLAADASLLESFSREVEVALGLAHSNVLQVQDFGDHHGIPYVVTDLLRGESADMLIATGRLNPGQSIRLLHGLVRGLAYMHAQQPPLVHRDVKPSNVFVTEQGDVKVVDYGLSKAVSDSSQSASATHGTTPYMSPERYLGRVSPAADVFAVGAVIYELMAGKRLFDGSELDPDSGRVSDPSPMIVMRQVEHVEQHLLKRGAVTAVDDVVQGLGAVMFKCLRKEPAERYQDCGELEDALDPFDRRLGASLRGVARAPVSSQSAAPKSDETQAPRDTTGASRGDRAPPPPPRPKPVAETGKRPRSRKAWYAVGGTVVVLGGVGAALAVSSGSEPGPAPSDLPSVSADASLVVAPAATEPTPAPAEVVAVATDVTAAPSPEVVAAAAEEVAPAGPVVPPGFVLVPAGKFTMGSPTSEKGRQPDETQREVTLTRSFYLKSTEVTQGQWTVLMKTLPARFGECGKDCPVERVSWFDAVAYLNALSAQEGLEQCYTLVDCKGTVGGGCKGDETFCEGDYTCKTVEFPKGLDCEGYRLPTEAEWEYAARAGTTTALYTGPLTIKGDNHGPELDPIAWYGGNSGVTYEGGFDCSEFPAMQFPAKRCGTHPVREKAPNELGLCDVLGNVWEWTWDFYKHSLGKAPVQDPVGPDKGGNRVVRGGSWVDGARGVRAANRDGGGPALRYVFVGFRPARSVPRSLNP